MALDDVIRATDGGRGGPDYRYSDQRRSQARVGGESQPGSESTSSTSTSKQDRQRDHRGEAKRPSVPRSEARHTSQPEDLYERLQDRTKLERDDINYASAVIGLATRFL